MKGTCDFIKRCHDDPSTLKPCTENTRFTQRCGHAIQQPCHRVQQWLAGVAAEPICQVLCKIPLPRCGHPAEVPCHQLPALRAWKGRGISASNTVEEGQPYGPLDFRCTETVRYVPTCGHLESLPCTEAFDKAACPNQCSKVPLVLPSPDFVANTTTDWTV